MSPQMFVGRLGRLTVAVTPQRSGEVLVEWRGCEERFEAVSSTALARHEPVVIVDVSGEGCVEVEPFRA